MGKRKASHRRPVGRRIFPRAPVSTAALRKQLWVTNPYRTSFERMTPNKLMNMGDAPMRTCGTWRVSSSWW